MAIPIYSTDLVDINLGTGTWSEPTGATAGGNPTAESDYFIEGTGCISKTFNATGLGGMVYDYGSGVTITSPAASFHWLYFGAPNAINTLVNGGYRIAIGSSTSAYKMWYILGSNTYTYGGWVCVPVDPSIAADATQGSPTSTLQVFGSVVNNSNAVAKGNPYGNDAIRYGRIFQCVNGESGNYATFSGAAAKNDANNATDGYNRWGLFQAVTGGYLMQGLFLMGTATTTVDFRDSNKNISIANTLKVASNFNAFEVRNVSSRVDWTSISVSALGTVSRGDFITTDNADINITSCTFTDMGTFGFQSNSTILSSIFRRCNLVTQNSAVLTDCTFDSTNDSGKALLSNNPQSISSCSFVSSGTKHAIEINTAGTYAFSGNTFLGYGANGTTDAAIYNNSGGSVTLNITNGGDTPTTRNGSGATTTINNSVTLTITVKDESGGNVSGARVAIYKSSDMTELMNITTNGSGVAATTFSYASDTPVIIRVRQSSTGASKYIAVQTSGTITSTGLTTTVTFIADSITVSTYTAGIATDFTVNTTRKTIRHTTGSTIYTINDLYTWLMDYFDDTGLMDDTVPMTAQTPSEYTLVNGWFIDDVSIQYLKSGAIQTSGWTHPTNTTGIRIITLSTITGVDDTDLGAAVAGQTTGDTGILLAYNTALKKLWVRTDGADDDFNNSSENINVNGSLAGAIAGSAAVTGETVYSNIFTLGTLVSGTTLDVYQNDSQITPWWSSEHIDVLVKVKEANVEIDSGNLTILARKYSTLYDHYVIDASTGRNPVPLAAFNDTNNQTAEGTVSGYSDIIVTFGATSQDMGNGSGSRPYDVSINCSGRSLSQVYEYLKYITRTGSSTTLNGVNGEYYQAVGDIRLNYTGESSGPFVQGSSVSSSGGGTGYIVSLIDNGTTGTLVVRNVHGTFVDTNTLTSGTTTATVNGTPETINQSKQSAFGTFAGGKFFGARGVWIYNMLGSDGNNYSLTDSTGTTQNPPSTISITVSSVASGDRVSVFRTTGDNEIIDKSVYTSHASANSSGSGTFTVTSTITADTPSSGTLRVVNRNTSGNIIDEQTYNYTSYSGMVFTLSGTLSQSYNSDDTAYVPYIDTTASSTSVSVLISYSVNRYIVTRVRKKGIIPFTVKGQLTNANLTVTAIRTSDTIVS